MQYAIAFFIICLILFGICSMAFGQMGLESAAITWLFVGLAIVAIIGWRWHNKLSEKEKQERQSPFDYEKQETQEKQGLQQAKNISVDSMSPIEYEKYVADRMKEWGYVNVRTTPSSGDFGADIIMGNKDGKRYCIQCKRHQNPVGYKAVQEIYSAKAYYNCDEAWVCSTNGFTKNAQEGAQRIGVKLFIIR